MQRVMSVEISGPRFLSVTTRFGYGASGSRYEEPKREVLQLALAALVADRAVERVVDEQELHDALLGGHGLIGMGVDFHAVGDGSRARRQRLGRLLHMHQ